MSTPERQQMEFDVPEAVKKVLPLAAQKTFADAVINSMQAGTELATAMQRGWSAVRSAGWEKDGAGAYRHKALDRMRVNYSIPTPTKPAAKAQPGAADVHSDRPMGDGKGKRRRRREKRKTASRQPLGFRVMMGKIEKTQEDQRLVSGWFSVIEKNGQQVIDRQDDAVAEAALLKAAHKFISNSRVGKLMHDGEMVAAVVESVVFTEDVQKALGIDLGFVGWWGTMKVYSDDVWSKVKTGELSAFSIGGWAAGREI